MIFFKGSVDDRHLDFLARESGHTIDIKYSKILSRNFLCLALNFSLFYLFIFFFG